jgi:small subunit ribosomal protein S20
LCSSSSVNTGTKAAESAASANSARTRLGTWKASVNADIAPDVPKYRAATTSRMRPAMRDSPVATEKIAVFTAMRLDSRGWADKRRAIVRRRRGSPAVSCVMANIASQIKRNQRSLRERAENRQYTSAIKTYFRRLETALDEGDEERAEAEHRRLIKLIDKAVKRGALHRNSGGRKKTRAARLRAGAKS